MKSKLLGSLCMVLLAFLYVDTVNGRYGNFYGGSLSNEIEVNDNGTTTIHVTLITGWILGKGPCGTGCHKDDIGRSTIPSRQLALASDKSYFGGISIDYRTNDDVTQVRPIEDLNPTPIVERVIDVSENAKYEQEIQTFSFLMPDYANVFDINYDGSSWRNLTLQGGSGRKWHFQTRVSTYLRNDTSSTNRCPQSISKSFYRIKLDEMGVIRIQFIDDDGDLIKCKQSDFVEGGDLYTWKPPNVTVYQNCTVRIDATRANGYRDDTWIAIPVTVRDYPWKPVLYGPDIVTSEYSLCSMSQQIIVQVLENLTTPEFVDPTLEANHEFIMYADTTWRTEIYAFLPSENTTIDSFTAFGIKQENLTFTPLLDDPRRDRVMHATVSWRPYEKDIGHHIACIKATDNTGVESAEQRCFILHVQADAFNHTTAITSGMPYFVDIPSPEQFVNCKLKTTCVVPLYVKCNHTITDIHVNDSHIDEYNVGPIETVVRNGENFFKADLFFAHSTHGQVKLCLYAKDIDGIESETVCISINIEPPDPCISSPCLNSGVCVADKVTGEYQCKCRSNFIGKHCETKHDRCHPNPCLNHGYCSTRFGQLCYCGRNSGYTGKYCEIDIYDCKPDSCNYHGTCTDTGVNSFKCDCLSRYNGTTCDFDKCPSEDPSLLECPVTSQNTTVSSDSDQGI
ncbi:hypothetical protein ACF0H5_023156 [Mactra antiquata]